MHIELVDSLRCPRPHEDSWLVASIARMEEREIVDGTLGCPVCDAEYPIRDHVAEFGGEAGRAATDDGIGAGEEDAMRLGAMLDLAAPGRFAVLAGAWAALARALHELTDVRLLLVNPPAGADVGWGISALRAPAGVLPLAGGSARAVALDAAHAALAPLAVGVLSAGGRLVAPAAVPVPDGIRELARDAALWVGERVSAPRLVGLGRRA